MSVVDSPDNHTRPDSRQLILDSARRELETSGILGLRVASVAEGAHCSITQIYRFFGDRDGLLAQVLGDLYEESVTNAFLRYREFIESRESVTIDDLVSALPIPSNQIQMKNQATRMQILATAVNNAKLRTRIEKVSQDMWHKWNDAIERTEKMMAPGERVDWRVFTIMLSVQSLHYRALLGDVGFSDEEYQDFLRDKFRLS